MQDGTFIGLDVHKATISVAVTRGERGGEVRHWGTVSHRPDHVRKLVEKLAAGGSRPSQLTPRSWGLTQSARPAAGAEPRARNFCRPTRGGLYPPLPAPERGA